MVNKIIAVAFFATTSFAFSQQTKQLKIIKQKYDIQVENYSKICEADLKKTNLSEEKRKISDQCRNEISLINSKRNQENLQELARIKSEGTGNNIAGSTEDSEFSKQTEEIPEYPGGFNQFRSEVGNNFDTEAITGDGIFRCEITFVIERDGSITEVKAAGSNNDFNTQAELAVYLVENKFSVAKFKGVPVRYRMRLPLSLSFE
ncbi:hypothetical protein [Kaistella jeonii]|uniref:hypothetical protein n=1 Tax=Kaistella jeonii TaxID=266749 RepID=UPI00068C9F68|nr:hypothetical protein [Kaistella jeonii]SFB76721.1 hypothetical protein SAMN05421876_10237 [Kaistella jeonii]VEI96466.1 Uncharacterised protein [Kaistella jeonii]